MGLKFWFKQFFIVLVSAFAVIFAAQFLKGHGLQYSITEAAIWSPITAIIFVAVSRYRFRKGQHCVARHGTNEFQQNKSSGNA